VNKHRMNQEFSSFAARLRESIASGFQNENFESLALELFSLQFKHNSAYRKICEARKITPQVAEHWTQIPAVPTSAFKELELSCIPPAERAAVFHSSGTTEQNPSRHFHCIESLAVYEASLWKWFASNLRFTIYDLRVEKSATGNRQLIILTPPPEQVPHSSLVHMFEIIRQKIGLTASVFTGNISRDGSWTIDFAAIIQKLNSASELGKPITILGTAFSFVHLLDFLVEQNLKFQLPENSRVMETGGYKNRSRTLPKTELHALIENFLGVPRENTICEYGMSELSSQAYDSQLQNPINRIQDRAFQFPPWARAQIISPETGREVRDGETGLIRIFDLANVFSVAAIQTEDLGIRHGDGFELIGRAQLAEPRGCSLMTA
jgi:hypothetical protein